MFFSVVYILSRNNTFKFQRWISNSLWTACFLKRYEIYRLKSEFLSLTSFSQNKIFRNCYSSKSNKNHPIDLNLFGVCSLFFFFSYNALPVFLLDTEIINLSCKKPRDLKFNLNFFFKTPPFYLVLIFFFITLRHCSGKTLLVIGTFLFLIQSLWWPKSLQQGIKLNEHYWCPLLNYLNF